MNEFDPNSSRWRLSLVIDILTAPSWRHRRVESMRLADGDQNRSRVSIDLTPSSTATAANGLQIMVPLAVLAKRPLIELDVEDAAGVRLPVLSSEENAQAAVAFLRQLLVLSGVVDEDATSDPVLLGQLREVVSGSVEDGDRAAQAIRERHKLPQIVEYWLDELREKYLFIVLIDKSERGRRQVIKYSYMPEEIVPRSSGARPGEKLLSPLSRAAEAFGILPAQLSIQLDGLGSAQSDHLEVRLPSTMNCLSITVPPDSSLPSPRTSTIGPVGHMLGKFPVGYGRGKAATVRFRASDSTRDRVARLAAIVIVAFVLASTWIPGFLPAIVANVDSTLALLLAVPALFLAYIGAPDGHALTRRLLWPLNAWLVTLAVFWVFLILPLILELEPLAIQGFWSTVGILCTLGLAFSLLGGVSRRLSDFEGRVKP